MQQQFDGRSLRTKSATLVDVATAGRSKTQFKQFLDRGHYREESHYDESRPSFK
jgi:hypothetical protein